MSSQKASASGFSEITGAGVAGTALGATASSYARVMARVIVSGWQFAECEVAAKITFTGLPVSQEQRLPLCAMWTKAC